MGLECQGLAIDPDDRREVERISGQRLVPVLCDEDRIVPDSTRILRYVIARYGERGILPPGADDQALSWIVEDYADEVLGPLIYAVIHGRTLSGEVVDPALRKELDKHLETQFRNLEQLFAARRFAFGDAPGLADIALHAFLSRLVGQGGREISSGFPHLKGWYSAVDAL
jgi:glutathione S-transferase